MHSEASKKLPEARKDFSFDLRFSNAVTRVLLIRHGLHYPRHQMVSISHMNAPFHKLIFNATLFF